MEANPLVSIGIPNYNYAHYILECLDSVANQTYQNIELIIVDDLSTDNSIEVIDNWIRNYGGNIRINFIKNDANVGLTKVCNIILKNAKGKYLQILDADDIFLPQKIETQLKVMEQNHNIALTYSNLKLIDESGKIINEDYFNFIHYDERLMPEGHVFLDLFDFNFIAYPLINRNMACEVGGFDESQQVHDYYLWLKLSEKYEVKYCPGKYALYRIHNYSMSNNSNTGVVSIENVLTTKYRYLTKSNKRIKDIIKRDIKNSVLSLYAHNHPMAGLWLKRNLSLSPNLKFFFYYMAYTLGVPFSWFGAIKKLMNKKSLND